MARESKSVAARKVNVKFDNFTMYEKYTVEEFKKQHGRMEVGTSINKEVPLIQCADETVVWFSNKVELEDFKEDTNAYVISYCEDNETEEPFYLVHKNGARMNVLFEI